jgi:hypothetical protein
MQRSRSTNVVLQEMAVVDKGSAKCAVLLLQVRTDVLMLLERASDGCTRTRVGLN